MKKVIKFEFRRNWLLFVIINLISIVSLWFIVWGLPSVSARNFSFSVGFIESVSLLVFLFYNFSYNKKKNSSEMYYAFPVTKKQLFLGKYLFSIIEISLSFIICIMFSYIFMGFLQLGLSYSGDPMSFSCGDALMIFYSGGLKLLFGIALFNIMLLVYYRANSIIDGIVYLLMLYFIPALIMANLSYILDYCHLGNFINNIWNFNSYGLLWSWVDNILFTVDKNYLYYYNLIACMIYCVLCLLSIIYLIHYAKNDYSERIGECDNKIFGYVTFIPIFSFLSILFEALRFEGKGVVFLVFVFLSIIQYVLYIIKNRDYLLPKKDWMSLVCSIIVNFIIVMIF